MASLLAPLPYLYCQESDLQALLSVDGVTARVDDNDLGVEDSQAQAYITAAINWATARLNMFLAPYYDQADLATDYVVNNWCVILACNWLCMRRGNPIPTGFEEAYKEVIEDLKLIRSGTVQLDLGQRDVMFPAWSNVRVDIGYTLAKIRVQRPISDRSPTGRYIQKRDLLSDWVVEPN